jgi:TolB protein
VINVDGTGLIRLTGGTALFTSPSWSPDGQHLVFTIADDEQGDIAIMQLADRHYQNITNTRNIDEYRPQWSPDGQWIMFATNAKNTHDIHIARIRPDGTEQTQLTHTASQDSDPSWSPDGAQIVFVSDRDFDLLAAARSRSFVPSRICRWISSLYASGEQGIEPPLGNAIYMMNADGSNVQRLTDSVGVKRQPSWRPARQ